MSFSTQLKRLRAEHQMTQKELAIRINVARSTVTGYETRNRQPSHEKLNAIADVFGVSVDYLIDDSRPDSLHPDSVNSYHEKQVDQRMLKTYKALSLKSKEDALDYLNLLMLREKELRAEK